MKKLLVLLLLFTSSIYAQEIATTENGKKVFLKKDRTYEFLKNSTAEKTKGEVKGMVTYFFNDNYGYKPDIGSEVIIHKVNKDSLHDVINEFQDVKSAIRLKKFYEKTGHKGKYYDDIVTSVLKKHNINEDKDYNEFCKNVISHVLLSEYSNGVIKLSVDGNGVFESELEDGFYEIIVKSKNRSSLNTAEGLNKVLNKIIEVKNGDTVNVKFEFDKY